MIEFVTSNRAKHRHTSSSPLDFCLARDRDWIPSDQTVRCNHTANPARRWQRRSCVLLRVQYLRERTLLWPLQRVTPTPPPDPVASPTLLWRQIVTPLASRPPRAGNGLRAARERSGPRAACVST